MGLDIKMITLYAKMNDNDVFLLSSKEKATCNENVKTACTRGKVCRCLSSLQPPHGHRLSRDHYVASVASMKMGFSGKIVSWRVSVVAFHHRLCKTCVLFCALEKRDEQQSISAQH